MSSPRIVLALAAVLAAGSAACSKNSEPPPAMTQQTQANDVVARATFLADDLPRLPPGVINAARPLEMTKAAYEFAARHPEVLRYVPCFCGCERAGHEGNHDCFVSSRDDAGRVRQWDAHGIGCQVCIDVAYQARQLHNSGASVTAIRAAIDKAYAGAPGHTPTPMPPSGGGHDHD